jgi:hypothetical protein
MRKSKISSSRDRRAKIIQTCVIAETIENVGEVKTLEILPLPSSSIIHVSAQNIDDLG